MERWKDIDGTNGRYQVSDEGRVRRVLKDRRAIEKYGPYKYMKPVRHKGHDTAYFDIQLGSKGRELVHRLVAKAFIPNPNNYPQVNHLNGDGRDNRASNLEWCTNRQNALHAKRNGRTDPFHKGKKVRCVELGLEFDSSFEAADYINQAKFKNSHRIKSLACNIRAAVYKKRPTAYGYHWEQF